MYLFSIRIHIFKKSEVDILKGGKKKEKVLSPPVMTPKKMHTKKSNFILNHGAFIQ